MFSTSSRPFLLLVSMVTIRHAQRLCERKTLSLQCAKIPPPQTDTISLSLSLYPPFLFLLLFLFSSCPLLTVHFSSLSHSHSPSLFFSLSFVPTLYLCPLCLSFSLSSS